MQSATTKLRVFSGIQPSGGLHLGNYLGAIRNWVRNQDKYDNIFCIVDLHTITVPQDPAALRENTLDLAAVYLASGIKREQAMFVQSHIPAHAELAWILECFIPMGWLERMTQFKEKSGRERERSSAGLFAYPALMAADILLHDVDEVPVGADQSQHVELARDVAVRFNGRYGPTFVVPKAVNPGFTRRLRELSDPCAKMGKSNGNEAGVLFLLDSAEVARRKVFRAVTDSGREVAYDPVGRPGVANLLEILAGCLDETPTALARSFSSHRQLKEAVADTVIATVRPIQTRYAELRKDDGTVHAILRQGAAQAREQTQQKVREVRARLGLLP